MPMYRNVYGVLFLLALAGGCSQQAPPAKVAAEVKELPFAKGTREATASIAANALTLKEYPPTPYPSGHREYVELLKEKCGIEFEVIHTPDFMEELRQEVTGWNETMEAEIKRKFGPNIFTELKDEAQKRWNASRAPQKN